MGLALLIQVAASAASVADKFDQCATWASTGECAINPVFMLENCAHACVAAPKPTKTTEQLKAQIRTECAGYANVGECSRNPAFMLKTCRAECDEWESKLGLSIDRNSLCVQWSLLGKCKSDPKRMGTECNTSCTIQWCLHLSHGHGGWWWEAGGGGGGEESDA